MSNEPVPGKWYPFSIKPPQETIWIWHSEKTANKDWVAMYMNWNNWSDKSEKKKSYLDTGCMWMLLTPPKPPAIKNVR